LVAEKAYPIFGGFSFNEKYSQLPNEVLAAIHLKAKYEALHYAGVKAFNVADRAQTNA
jgi:hypothetical protein